jgi:hypothetical protein
MQALFIFRKTRILILGIALISSLFTLAQKSNSNLLLNEKLNDGPYVFIKKKKLIEKTIIDGKVFSKDISLNSYKINFEDEKSVYHNVSKIAALSDLHGQYNLTISLLIKNQIIDNELNWVFGKGHLVIVGDVFDRGDKMTELLWFIFFLEKKAKDLGGKVHYILGNHEYMIFENDLRYIHKKYKKSEKLLYSDTTELYGDKTVLGRWLRSKPTIIRIDDKTFVHGGISSEFISSGYDIDYINDYLRTFLKNPYLRLRSRSVNHKKYLGSTGPLWYRGYFFGDLKESEIDVILDKTQSKHIIVGHCSNQTVVQLYNKKIFGVDSNIKVGGYGELLLYNNNVFSRKNLFGQEILFD